MTEDEIRQEHEAFRANPAAFIRKIYSGHDPVRQSGVLVKFQNDYEYNVKRYEAIKEHFHSVPNPHKHQLSWCSHCTIPMIVCSRCGNNSCNGGQKCPLCPSTYELERALSEFSNSIPYWKDEALETKINQQNLEDLKEHLAECTNPKVRKELEQLIKDAENE